MAAANWHFSANMYPRNSSHTISNPTECIVTKKYLFFSDKIPKYDKWKWKVWSLSSLCKVLYVGAYIHIHPPIEQKQLIGRNQMKLWPGDNDNDIDYDN